MTRAHWTLLAALLLAGTAGFLLLAGNPEAPTIGGQEVGDARSTAADAAENRPQVAPPRRATQVDFELRYTDYRHDPDEPLTLLWYQPERTVADPRWSSVPGAGDEPSARWLRELLRRHPAEGWDALGVLGGDDRGIVHSAHLGDGEYRAVLLAPVGRNDRFSFQIQGEPCRLERPYPDPAGIDLNITGRVTDARSSAPLVDTRVALFSPFARLAELLSATPMLETRTATDGRYELALAVDEPFGYVMAITDGYLPGVQLLEDRLITTGGRVPDLDFALIPGGDAASVIGRVVNDQGRTLVADLRLLDQKGRWAGWREMRGMEISRRSQPTGAFELTAIPPGLHVLTASAEGHRPWVKNLELAPRSRTDLGTIALTAVPDETEPAATFVGSLADAEGLPIADAEVEVRERSWKKHVGRTGDDGQFQIEPIPAGDHWVTLRAAGWPEVRLSLEFPPGEVVHYHHRQGARKRFIGGTVVALRGGHALPDIDVEVRMAGRHGAELVATAQTDSEGRFRIDGLPDGDASLLLEWQQPYAELPRERIELDRDDHRFRFPFPELVRIAGVVQDADGVGIAGVTVVPAPLNPGRIRAQSAADGSYSLELLMTDLQSQRLTASRSGYQPATGHFLREAGGRRREIRWDPVLYAEDELAEIHGTVTDAEGRPLVSVRCAVFAVSGKATVSRAFGKTDSEGGYRLAGVRPGPVDLEFQSDTHHRLEQRFQVERRGKHRVDVVMEPVARAALNLRLEDESGAPVSGVTWSAWAYYPRQSADGATAADGRIELRDWPLAEGRVSLEAPGFPEHLVQLTRKAAAPGKTRRAVMRRGALSVRGVVVDPDGATVPHTWVLLTEAPRDGTMVHVNIATDEQGRFSVDNLAAGTYRCGIDARTAEPVNAPAGGPELTLTRGW